MTKDEIKLLTERIVSGIATKEEIQLYHQLYESFQLSQDDWQDDFNENKSRLEVTMQKAIWRKAGLEKPTILMKWVRLTSAAAIAIAIGSTFFFVFKNRTHDTPSVNFQADQERFTNDAAPGEVGAILTLSNGKTIVLDSTGNGALVKQGASEVFKKNGELIYTKGGQSSEIVYNTITTSKGRQYGLVLADGSKVWLNAASSITFPTAFEGNERRVTIMGEVYFEIAHQDQMPFVVQKGDARVEVLGTHFNVNSYDDENFISVTLLEGLVKVKKANDISFMKPGQQAQLQQHRIKLINNADVKSVMAWKNGFFDFDGTDIGSLMRQLSRWYDVDVVYDKRIDDLFYAEIPRNTMLSDVLKALELTGRIRFEIKDRKISVLPKE